MLAQEQRYVFILHQYYHKVRVRYDSQYVERVWQDIACFFVLCTSVLVYSTGAFFVTTELASLSLNTKILEILEEEPLSCVWYGPVRVMSELDKEKRNVWKLRWHQKQ